MKYIYKHFYQDIVNRMPGQFGEVTYTRSPVGGNFLAEENPEDPATFLKISSAEIVDNFKDRKHATDLYLAGFFGGKEQVQTGYIGKWNDAIYDIAKIYYIITDDGPREMIMVKYNGMSLSNLNGVQYICNIDGNMMDCYPEEGDILFDNYEEAEKYYNDIHKGVIKQRSAEEVKQKLEELKALYGIKNITDLGDGIYAGQMSGSNFYYKGNQYICPIGIRCSHPVNKIIEIKDGKVSFNEWETTCNGQSEK